MIRRSALFAAVLSLVFVDYASAHPGHGGHGLESGFVHPLTGLDHLLAMIAVGLWASQIGGRAMWVVPLAFVGCMSIGGIAEFAGVAIPLVEPGILASMFVFGLLIAIGLQWPAWAAATIAGLFAIFHGAAHASEMAADQSAIVYSIGFVLATSLLHLAGIGLGTLASRSLTPIAVRSLGGAVVAGAALVWMT